MNWPDRLYSKEPKRILAIDGGGVRGAVAIAFLQQLERTLREKYGKPDLILSDYFDLIGGTSVGAILAAGLAMGRSADEVADTFKQMGPKLFRQYMPRLPLIQARFDPRRLGRLLRETFGAYTMASAPWKTGFAAISKRVDTGSSWVMTNSPKSKYWLGDPQELLDQPDPTLRKVVPNGDYELAKVIQSSAAAPFFFDMVPLEVARGESGVFFDGAMTPHGNPALQLAMTVLIPAYGFNWSPGKDELMVVSIGAGGPRPKKPDWVKRPILSIWKALHALVSMAYDTSELNIITMQWLGYCPQPWRINSEIGDEGHARPKGHKPFWTFLRYDAPLEGRWLKEHLNRDYSPAQIAELERMDDDRQIPLLFDIGAAAAKIQIRPEHFPDPAPPAPKPTKAHAAKVPTKAPTAKAKAPAVKAPRTRKAAS
jgi:hypothetical protein